MAPFKASFNIASIGTVNFGAIVVGHEDKAGALRELNLNLHIGSEADWNTLRSMANWGLEMVPMPWGNTVEVLVKGGPGSGTLIIPGLITSATAYLDDLMRNWTNNPSGHSIARSHWIIAP